MSNTEKTLIGRRTVFTSFSIPVKIPESLLSQPEKENTIMFKAADEDGEETEITYTEALKSVGTGYFQYFLIFVCGLIYMTCSVSAAVMGFLLPVTKCRLHIMSHERGLIISSGLVGMVIGTFFWEAVADTKGRKVTLLMCLAVESAAAILTSISFHKYMFLFVRFFNGFGSIGAASLVFAYASDFIVPEYRDLFLSALEAFWGIGLVYIPFIGLLIFPSRLNKDFGMIHTWNVYALICAIPAVTSFILLLFLPESPAFLLYQGRRNAMVSVLNDIFMINHRTKKNKFVLIETEEDIEERISLADYMKQFASEKKKLFKGKYLSRILKVCSISMLINFSFLTVSIWIPTLLDRHDYEKHVKGKDMTFCSAAMLVGQSLEKEVPCNEDVSADVFRLTILISIFILPFTAVLFIALNYIGKSELLIVLTVTSGVSCLFLNMVQKKSEIILCCILFLSSADLIETMLLLFGVHIFPPQLCALGLALIVTSGRAAAVVGNSMFGALIDKHCYFPMYLFVGCIFLAVIIELFLPQIEQLE